jgi:hypothetical protein
MEMEDKLYCPGCGHEWPASFFEMPRVPGEYHNLCQTCRRKTYKEHGTKKRALMRFQKLRAERRKMMRDQKTTFNDLLGFEGDGRDHEFASVSAWKKTDHYATQHNFSG